MTLDEKIVEAVARAIAGSIEEERYWDAPDFQRAARAAITAYQAEAWQPIETAPKDGTTVLVGHAHAAFTAWWSEEDGGWVDDDTSLSGRRLTYPATHWQPLPPAPKATPDRSEQ